MLNISSSIIMSFIYEIFNIFKFIILNIILKNIMINKLLYKLKLLLLFILIDNVYIPALNFPK